MTSLLDLLGRLHPLLVHLPIGILCLAVFFVVIARSIPTHVTKLTFLLGSLSSVLAVASGLSLTRGNDYDPQGYQWHQWMGITLACVAFGTWWLIHRFPGNRPAVLGGAGATLILLTITGHLGGSLTHGDHYLFEPISTDEQAPPFDPSAVTYQQAVLFADVVQPILNTRCVSCHGKDKQKGGLRLDAREFLLKGGKNGKLFEASNPEESMLVNRIDLPMDHEDHMPPKERKQLTDFERDIIQTWILKGASFDVKLSGVLDSLGWLTLQEPQPKEESYPEDAVREPDERLMQELTQLGVAITPVAQGSRYLQVNFVSATEQAAGLLPRLEPIARNVVSLKIAGASLDATAWSTITKMEYLTIVDFSTTNVGDAELVALAKLQHVKTINLSFAKLSLKGLEEVARMRSLRKIVAHQVLEDTTLYEQLRSRYPQIAFEFGGYSVPTLATDTTQIKTN